MFYKIVIYNYLYNININIYLSFIYNLKVNPINDKKLMID